MALYRFLFAPVLLAIAVVSGSGSPEPSRTPPPEASQAAAAPAIPGPPTIPAALERGGSPRPIRAR